MYTADDHTFAVCAYKESPFLEECIQSLLCQSVRSHILISTSTPSPYLGEIAARYQLPLYVNHGKGGIGEDWNFGYQRAETSLVTIAHQDDVYEPEYTKRILAMINDSLHPLIAFTGYYEIRNGVKVRKNRLLQIKRFLLFPLRVKAARGNKFIRRRSLSLGNGICCPSVTYVRANLPDPVFLTNYKSNLDWQAWERLSMREGDFLYDHALLTGHRIHADSETSHLISDNRRNVEDFEMFCKFWPTWMARLLGQIYVSAQKSNTVG